MIEITSGTLEEQIIKLLQKKYPITLAELATKIHVSRDVILRVLKKLQTKDIVQLEPLPGKTYIRLLRHDFSFVGKKRQRKFVKHHYTKKKPESKEYDGMMYQ